jgi:hypothetical protein
VARAGSGGSIDALFGGGASPSREDVAAASTLADAFKGTAPSGTPASEPQIGGRPAHPAATELSLDHVFRDGVNGPQPPRGGSGGSGGSVVSYDQFFSQPAHSGSAGADASSGPTPPSGGSDDIEQFNAWLQGLKKR